jgi:DNA-directed RNA polymerase subunit beta
LKTNTLIERHSFGKISRAIDYPNLLSLQLESFKKFLQDDIEPELRDDEVGLQQVFKSVFPIIDTRENFRLDFVEYYLDKPRYSEQECQERGVTYSVALRARLRLSVKDESSDSGFSEAKESDVYLGNLPYMTAKGTFIINGAERVIVNQLHRSPGVFFDSGIHPNGTPVYSARIIPFKGSWVEFTSDVYDVLYVYIDRKKKFPITVLLRALGYSSNLDILKLFIETVDLSVSKLSEEKHSGLIFPEDIVDEDSGELVVEKQTKVSEAVIAQLKAARIKSVSLVDTKASSIPDLIFNTVKKDPSMNEEEALNHIYHQLRSGEAPDVETARALIERMFFNDKRYDLGKVGRHRINNKLNLKIDSDTVVLTHEDIIAIIKYLLELRTGEKNTDDIDHLGNRRVRTVGEQLGQQLSVGLARMARTMKEKMNIGDKETLTPQELVNARTISSVINTFFGTSQLSQFMDQTNPLAELTHKRRLSALGPGGLTRERAGFEVRDIHYTHYGRLCPIETPEGPNIGLISSLSVFAKINDFGFIETPYREVKNGKMTKNISYLSSDDEDRATIAQVNLNMKDDAFLDERVLARHRGEFITPTTDEITHMDVAPNQMVSAAASLIPFLEHDDANRALMGSNMQRQAVPLLKPQAPLVGTGLERNVAKDTRAVVTTEFTGVVDRVDSKSIRIKIDKKAHRQDKFSLKNADDYIKYDLTKFQRTNQDTCINQRPLVEKGQKVKAGDIIADGAATERGDLALGSNVLVSFMPWKGYNYEDAIIISERLVAEDVYTSIHVQEFELQVRDTKRGEEELTREIPNVSEEATRNLDENGIVRVGAEVKPSDILVGKVTPKGETDPTPEERLLRAIFGNKAGDVKDASLKAPPGLSGIVVDTKLFKRKKKDLQTRREDKKRVEVLEREIKGEIAHLKEKTAKTLGVLLEGTTAKGISSTDGSILIPEGTKLTKESFAEVEVDSFSFRNDWIEEQDNSKIRAIMREYRWLMKDIDNKLKREKHKIQVGDELPPGIVQMAKVYVAQKRKLSVGDKMAGRHGNKGVVAKVAPVADLPHLADGTPVDIILNPLGVPSRMNLGQIFETTLGWAGKLLGKHYETPVYDGAAYQDVLNELAKANLPNSGKATLYDGFTGDKIDDDVTVGYIYMLKLGHMIADKTHARSIGPYSLITQQPLGGKAQFGGQRFGEMEVWALEAYGAAHTLREILTVKSDDVQGRSKVYEAIVKGENLPEPGTPESFNVLIRELQGLGLEIKVD